MDFTEARHIARMQKQQVMDYLEISESTYKRYTKTGKAPKAVIECLLMIGGKMPTFSLRNDFTGWSFGSGFLYSPGGDKFTSGDVLARRYDIQLIKALTLENQKLKKRVSMSVPSNVIPFPLGNKKTRRFN